MNEVGRGTHPDASDTFFSARNVVLLIPGVVLLDRFFSLTGVIAAQPLAELFCSLICLALYLHGTRTAQ